MKRPISITLLGWLFIVAGAVGLIYHLSDRPVDRWIILIAAIRILAVIGGVFLLLGHSWARWLLIGWLTVHVVLSAFHSVSQTLAHLVLLVVISWLPVVLDSCQIFFVRPVNVTRSAIHAFSKAASPSNSPRDRLGHVWQANRALIRTSMVIFIPRDELLESWALRGESLQSFATVCHLQPFSRCPSIVAQWSIFFLR